MRNQNTLQKIKDKMGHRRDQKQDDSLCELRNPTVIYTLIFNRSIRKLRALFLASIMIFLLMGGLVGCSGLQQTTVMIAKDIKQAQLWLEDGWPLYQADRPLMGKLWQLFTGIIPTDPYYQLVNGIPVLQDRDGKTVQYIVEEEVFYASAFVADTWQHKFEKIKGITVSEQTQVLLYHTHNAETYLPSDGVSKVTGQNGGVAQAADLFQKALQQKYGIRTVHNTTLHDYPNWNRAYQNSLATVQQLIKANPDVKAVFDVHRDAGFSSKQPTTTTINGKSAARIMLVIGANHENWKENLAFARQLEAKCDELYPGLLRDNIHIKETGRYNQQAHPRAVLLEIGSDLNTQEEADYAMECFAHVVYEVLKTA